MALRLAAPADPKVVVPSSTPASTGVPAQRLAPLAVARLAAHDLPGWRALWREAGTVEDPHRRYQARIALTETALAARTAAPAAVAERFAALAAELVTVLEEEPREPVLLNHAGVACYELGALDAAGPLFEAARRLDADLPHVAGNLAEVRRRRKAGTVGLHGLPAHVRAELRTLLPRARRVAQAARPAAGLTISLCMIVKDEEAMLGRCLAAVRDAVDELVIVDTGSTDRTVEIAESFGARVLHHPWTGDFAAARNVSFEAATGDWLLYLDADEVLVDGDAERLRALSGRTWREALYLVEINHTGGETDGTAVTHNALRLFRNRPEYRFEGRIHEQVAQHLPAYLPERTEVTDVRIEHFGYLGVVRDAKDKSRRNIELLERQIAEGDETPILHFNIGSEHAAAGDAPKAMASFERAWELLAGDPDRARYGYAPSLTSRSLKALRVCGELDRAAARADEALRMYPGFTDVVFEQGHIARERGRLDAAVGFWRQCLQMGDAPSAYSAMVGCGSYLATAAMSDVLLRQGRLEEAESALLASLDEHPSYLGSVERLAQVLLRRGVAPAEVVATVHGKLDVLTPAARFLLAVPLYEAGAVAEAETELRAVLAAQPSAGAARVALAEALLSQDRLDEAAAEARRVAIDEVAAPAAARTALFATLADGADAARDLDRARAVLPAAEHALFAAWRAGVNAADASVPAAALPVALTMLDALARLERFEAFERLAAAYERIDAPWRERREHLAALYLRRGYLASAADEWLAVVEAAGPDAHALAGLAQVAKGQGLDEDAALLAAEAAQLAAAAA